MVTFCGTLAPLTAVGNLLMASSCNKSDDANYRICNALYCESPTGLQTQAKSRCLYSDFIVLIVRLKFGFAWIYLDLNAARKCYGAKGTPPIALAINFVYSLGISGTVVGQKGLQTETLAKLRKIY